MLFFYPASFLQQKLTAEKSASPIYALPFSPDFNKLYGSMQTQ